MASVNRRMYLLFGSSEIGYASSPPREVLTRGQSIDSVDRPFHPSDWVDVNLEVPGTPRATSAMTNLTLDTTLYPSSTLPSRSSGGRQIVRRADRARLIFTSIRTSRMRINFSFIKINLFILLDQ